MLLFHFGVVKTVALKHCIRVVFKWSLKTLCSAHSKMVTLRRNVCVGTIVDYAGGGNKQLEFEILTFTIFYNVDVVSVFFMKFMIFFA